MLKRIAFLALIFASVFYACNESIPAEEFIQNNIYAPIEVGKYWEYEVDSTIFDNEGMTVFNTSSFVREEIIEKREDVTGDSIFFLEISKKSELNEDYKGTDLWVVKIQNGGLVRIEENLTFIKLLFPPEIGLTWEGNQFPDDTEVLISGEAVAVYKDWNEYEVVDREVTRTIGSNSFDDIIVIQHVDSENLIELRSSFEYYARDVGMIEREMWILDTQCIEPACEERPWDDKAERGFILRQRLIDHN